MKATLTIILVFISLQISAQTNTEIFIFNLDIDGNSIEVKDGKNISNNEGYDNQPSFMSDRYLLFSSTRNGQTDIAKYDLRYGSKTWLNFTEGGEYTPLKVPGKREVSAVRLDKDGKQRLYSYDRSNGESTELIKDLKVAYYTWSDENTIVSAVIEDEQLNLFSTNLSEGTSRKYATNVGRSFHKIPGSDLVSFISKENNEQWQIKSLDPKTGKTSLIASTINNVEDICWLDSKTLLSGKDDTLYKLRLQRDNDWKPIADLKASGIKQITRLAVNSETNKLLLAAEIGSKAETTNTSEDQKESSDNDTKSTDPNPESVEAIVQRNLDAYNARDIDAFMKDYADDVKLYAYPNTLRTEGKDAMRKSYQEWFEGVPDLSAFIKNRIVFGNKVIDEEQVTANGKIINAVAIYEVENGKIIKVTFMQ